LTPLYGKVHPKISKLWSLKEKPSPINTRYIYWN
jgi:hypothetical protein